MKSIAKKTITLAMIGLLQLGLVTSISEASPKHNEPPRQEQRNDKNHRDQDREQRVKEENQRHEREMRRRPHESEQEWHKRQQQERDRHDEAIRAITGAILHLIAQADKD